MIRPERDPHWLLGVEHGRDRLALYTFADAENQRRYVLGYLRGDLERRMRFAAHPYQQSGVADRFMDVAQQAGPRFPWKP